MMFHRSGRVIRDISLVVFVLFAFSTHTAIARNIWIANFEQQNFDDAKEIALCCDHAASIVTDPVHSGKFSVKFILNSDDIPKPGKPKEADGKAIRAELMRTGTAHIGSTRWYKFSVNIDPSWEFDGDDKNGTVIAQWHTLPDSDEGEASKSPHLSLRIKKGKWVIVNLSDPNLVTIKSPKELKTFTKRNWPKAGEKVIEVEKGKWVDWVVYAKWSFKSDGRLKVWKDSSRVVDYEGPNTHNDKNDEYFKFGVYKSWWKGQRPANRETMILYYDDVRIGDENENFEPPTRPGASPRSPRNLAIAD